MHGDTRFCCPLNVYLAPGTPLRFGTRTSFGWKAWNHVACNALLGARSPLRLHEKNALARRANG